MRLPNAKDNVLFTNGCKGKVQSRDPGHNYVSVKLTYTPDDWTGNAHSLFYWSPDPTRLQSLENVGLPTVDWTVEAITPPTTRRTIKSIGDALDRSDSIKPVKAVKAG